MGVGAKGFADGVDRAVGIEPDRQSRPGACDQSRQKARVERVGPKAVGEGLRVIDEVQDGAGRLLPEPLAAFIGGQKNEEALEIVQKFLEDEKNLDRDLRLKVLEAVDNLERSVEQ